MNCGPADPPLEALSSPRDHYAGSNSRISGGGQVRVIACLEDPAVIGKILAHLESSGPATPGAGRRPEVRGPPPGPLALG